jgi:tetratricopeptide (TPR) repeat protein
MLDALWQNLSKLWRKPKPAEAVDEISGIEWFLFPPNLPDRDLWRHSTHGDFWLLVVEQIVENEDNRELAFAWFDAHTDSLNLEFASWLAAWGNVRLELDLGKDILADLVRQFNILISEFPRGSRASNLEIAIECDRLGLKIYDRETNPEKWAVRQVDLGADYQQRILGDRAENLELAIECYRQALQVYTQAALPQNWAMTQNNLGNAYGNRILGDRAENLELAIECYRQALQVRTQAALPQNWATTQNNLGAAYQNRILGDRAENLELAIDCYRQALQVRTRSALPQAWATTQNNLGNAYQERILGDRAENLELAIDCYQQALQVITRSALPQAWAMTQNNLGIVYGDRILGDRAENQELAIDCYQQALQVRTRSALPQDWALTQNNLGTAYQNRILGDSPEERLRQRAENLELAIDCFQQALQVRTQQALPRDWANTQNNLGEAYILRLQLFGIQDRHSTIELLQSLTTFFLEQQRWRNASSSYTLWAKALTDNSTKPDYLAAVTPLLNAIDLDSQHNPDLIDTDINEFATILPHLNWQPPHIPAAWQGIINREIDSNLLAKIYFNIGLIGRSEGRWQLAIDYFTAAWQIYQASDNLQDFAEINYQLANTHHLMSNLSKAGMYYRDARRLFEHLENQRRVAFCDHALGRLLLQLGDITRSISTFQQAIYEYQQLPPEDTIESQIADAKYYLREIGTIYPAIPTAIGT